MRPSSYQKVFTEISSPDKFTYNNIEHIIATIEHKRDHRWDCIAPDAMRIKNHVETLATDSLVQIDNKIYHVCSDLVNVNQTNFIWMANDIIVTTQSKIRSAGMISGPSSTLPMESCTSNDAVDCLDWFF